MRPKKYDIKLTDKQKQFKESVSNPKTIPMLFTEAAVFEERWNKDITDFTKEEALEFLKTLNSISVKSLIVYAWTIDKYTQFCGKESKVWNQISRNDLESLIDEKQRMGKYFSESHLNALTAVLFNPVDRFILRGFYDGLCGEYYEDFKDIYPKSFNKQNLTVQLSNGNIKHISQELYDIAMESAESYKYIVYSRSRNFTRNLCDWTPDKQDIIKIAYGSKLEPTLPTWKRKIRNRIEIIRNYLDIPYLNIPNLRRSGIYNHLLKLSEMHNCSIKQAVNLPEFDAIVSDYELNKDRLDSIKYRFSTEEYT